MEVYKPITDNTFWKYKYAPFKIEDIDINKSKLYPIKKCLEDKIIIDKNEYYNSNNNTNLFHDNLNKFENIMRSDDSNNKFQDRININLKDKKTLNINTDLGKRKNF